MATRGYNSYRGRSSGWKILLIVVLVAALLGAVGFLYCQNHLVYDDQGEAHLELPWSKPEKKQEKETEKENPIKPDDVHITREEPKRPTIAPLHARELSFERLTWSTADVQEEAVVANIKRRDGAIAYDTALTLPEGIAKGSEATLTNLKELLQADSYAVARIYSLLDSAYARAQMEQAGLLRDDQGDVWYDGSGECWLDPTKSGTLEYLTRLCTECVSLGFDEIMLDFFSYPTTGNVGRIFYGENTDKTAALTAFAEKLREALPKGTVLSIALHQPLVDGGGDSGITPELLQSFDRIYADTGTMDVAALTAALPKDFVVDGRIVPMVGKAPEQGSYMVIG